VCRVLLLDEVQPQWHFRERHRVRVGDAPPAAVFAAVDALTWGEVPLFRALMTARALGLRRPRAGDPILGGMVRIGFAPLRRRNDEVVYGGVGRPWSAAGRLRPLAGGDPAGAYGAVTEPGWARMALNFHLAGGVLATETRVWLTDPGSRRRFAAYWALVRPFSGLIRRAWLAAIAHRLRGSP
jgi:hypothetical protein